LKICSRKGRLSSCLWAMRWRGTGCPWLWWARSNSACMEYLPRAEIFKGAILSRPA